MKASQKCGVFYLVVFMSRKYTEKEWIEFLKRIGEGRSARDVCGNDKDMPTWRLVSDKLNSDNGFAQRYAMAMENRGQVYADKITDTVNDMLNGTIDYNQARVAIDALKWQSSKLAPKKYGDVHRMEVKHEASYLDALKEVSKVVDGEESTLDNAIRTRKKSAETKTIQ
jgi:hypothetical protein